MNFQHDFDEDYTAPLNAPYALQKAGDPLLTPPSLRARREEGYHLLNIEDDNTKRIVVLDKPYYSIGRHPSNSIVLQSKFVSKHHASLIRLVNSETKQNYFRIVDGDSNGKPSTNGILVNGQNCRTHDLENGDILYFGNNIVLAYLFIDDVLSVST